MKRLIPLIAAVLLLLASCTAMPSPHADGALDPDTGITLAVQYPIIDKSCETLRILIENGSNAAAQFGTEWSLEKRVGSTWRVVPFRANVGFESILHSVEPGGSSPRTIRFAHHMGSLTDGEYRIVLEISGAYYTAPFSVGASAITADTPHGFAPLDTLPDDYTTDDAAADGCVVIRHGEMTDGSAALAEFLRWKGSAQLRIASLTIEGDVVLHDIVSDGNCFIYTRDASRDAWGGELFRGWYANLLTDGCALYLSNHGVIDDAARYVCEIPEEIAETVRSFTPLELAAWSPDGICSAFLNGERMWINARSTSYIFTPSYAKNVFELIWTSDTTLLIIGRDGGKYVYEYRHIPEDGMDEYLSHTVSDTAPRWHDGELILPR